MPYPDLNCQDFMYSAEKDSVRHQTRPSGRPDFAYMVKGRSDYWLSPSLTREQKKKTLILADWSARGWTSYKKSAVSALLARMMRDGFELYGDLLKMNDGCLNLITDAHIAEQMLADSYQSIEKVAAGSRYRLAKDKIHILDDYWVNYLLGTDSTPGPRTLNCSDIEAVKPNFLPTIFSFLNTARPGIESLTKDVLSYPEKLTHSFDECRRAFPKAEIKQRYCYVFLEIKGYDLSAFSGECNSMERLEVRHLSFSLAHLVELFNFAAKAREIDLYNCLFTEESILEALAPSNLEEINLSGTNISSEGLQSILDVSKNLKKLYLGHCKAIGAGFRLADSIKLEELDLRGSAITSQGLTSISAVSPKLKKLNLKNCKAIGAGFRLEVGTRFEELEELDLSYNAISSTGLRSFIAASPNLKILYLYDCSAIWDDFHLEDDTRLDELSLSGSPISSQGLKSFIDASPNLKKLYLDNCTAIGADFSLADRVKLGKLEALDLSWSTISSQGLMSILDASPNLKILNLSNCPAIGTDFCLADGTRLEELETLDLRVSVITSQWLMSILDASPNLKVLKLARCSFDGDVGGALRARLSELQAKGIVKEDSPDTLDSCVQAPSSGRIVDGDTAPDKHKKYKCKAVFFPVQGNPVSSYRLSIFQTLGINMRTCSMGQAFRLGCEGDLGLREVSSLVRAHTDLYATLKPDEGSVYGKCTITLTSAWQALPSLSPSEVMTHYHLNKEVDVEIKYSSRDNLYYIRSTGMPEQVEIDFIIYIPSASALPEDIQALVDTFNCYGSGALTVPASLSINGHDYLQAIIQQKKGACRHRATAFKWMMDERGTPSRIVTNDCHAYVEVKVNGSWLRCDLGGYPATLEIDASHEPGRLAGAPRMIEQQLSLLSRADLALAREYAAALSPWDKLPVLSSNVDSYCQRAVDGSLRQRLIECDTEEGVFDLHFALQGYCRRTKRPIFYVNSPDDLMCASPYIHLKDGNAGELRAGPGGPLHEFLTNASLKNRVLLVNYSSFEAKDLVTYNALLDDVRKADNTLIPEDTVLVGLVNEDNPVRPGSDFYGRFGAAAVERCPLSTEHLSRSRPVAPVLIPTDKVDERCHIINLYHAVDWKECLIGRYVMTPSGFEYEEGALKKAISSGLPIRVMNGPIDKESYRQFWLEAFQLGAIVNGGLRLELSCEVQARLSGGMGYNWDLIKRRFRMSDALGEPDFVLNPQTMSDLFYRYAVNSTQQLEKMPGVIDAHKGRVLNIHLIRTLNEDEWARVLEACDSANVQVWVRLAPGVSLPMPLQPADFFPSLSPVMLPLTQAVFPTQVIESTDVDATVCLLATSVAEPLIIDVSECHDHDLLSRIKHQFINDKLSPPRIEFTQRTCAVSDALTLGKTVILKGVISGALADELAPFLLSRRDGAQGRLILVSADTSYLQYMQREENRVSVSEKRALLGVEGEVRDMPLVQLRACYLSKDPWVGMRDLSPAHFDVSAVDAGSRHQTEAFKAARASAVKAVLAQEPYVFLTGLSGVGKTSFVLEVFGCDAYQFYQGESYLEDWAQDATPTKQKILFIDEANLSDTDWTVFEGLYHRPRGLLIEGRIIPISDEHKVIFAGNPVSYGEGRRLASFFERHGNAVLFEPLPSAMLYESLLKPVFAKTALAADDRAISEPFLAVYAYLVRISKAELLISPRELQMMALLVDSHCRFAPKDAPIDVAKHMAYHVSRHLVPANVQQDFEALFNRDLKPITQREVPGTDFLVTQTRQEVAQQLAAFLALKETRAHYEGNAKCYGGLGGVILEGEPGIGKSDFVLTLLASLGYQEQTKWRAPVPREHTKPFYQMFVSMTYSDKQALLLKAFDEGAVVVIDEINSSTMMERMLNALLMGKTPEGKPPLKPGFMIIGTQNPVSMAGRRAPSTALARRVCTITIPPYPANEMIEILLKKGVPESKARILVEVYHERLAYAIQHQKEPLPTFRDLLKLAEAVRAAALRKTDVQMQVVTGVGVETQQDELVVRGGGFCANNFAMFTPVPMATAALPPADPPPLAGNKKA